LVAREELLVLFEQMHSRIGCIHVNDVRRVGEFAFVPVGAGLALVRDALSRLREQRDTSWMGIEEASRSGWLGFRQAIYHTRQVPRVS
jgi:sugar phosphate isomerase/epimerase